MPYFKPAGSERLRLPSAPDSYWVEIKQRATFGDRREARKAMISRTLVDLTAVPLEKMSSLQEIDTESGKGLLVESDFEAYRSALMLRMLTAWNLTGPDDQVAPITAETLDELDEKDGDFIWEAIQKRDGGRPAADNGPFASNSADSSRASQQLTPT